MSVNSHIEGVLKLTSPMNCADPTKHWVDEAGRVTTSKGVTSCTATVRQRIANDLIPYFPANDLRGRLRRKAADLVMKALTAKGEKISVELYAALCAGSYNAQPDSSGMTIEEASRAARHVYMGLFGGGSRLIRSGYSVQDLVPIIQTTVAAGMVPEKYMDYAPRIPQAESPDDESQKTRNQEGWRLLDVRSIIRVDDTMRVLRQDEMMAYIDNPLESVAAYQNKVMANRKKVKESKESAEAEKSTKTDIGNIVSVQSIIAGTQMYFRLDLSDSMTSAQVGLMLSSICALFNEQALGGWCRTGFGKYEANEFSLLIDGQKMEFLAGERGNYMLSETAAPYIEAMNQELSALTSAELMEFFESRQSQKAA